MFRKKKKRRTWAELEATEKLAFIWTLLYALLIIGTASAILYPAYREWRAAHEEEKQGAIAVPGGPSHASLYHEDLSNGLVRSDRLAGKVGRLSRRALLG